MTPNEHFFLDEKKNKIELTDNGRQVLRWSNAPSGEHSHAMDKLQEHVERSLWAHHRYRRDQHYMIHEQKVVLIDESTGRAQPDRHWRDGMHQAVEVKEGVPVTKATEHTAEITYQSYYRLYKKLAGMTGTAAQNWFEIYRVYRLWVVCVPTNKPILRQQWPDRVFPNEDAKFNAVVDDIKRLHAAGRPLLIGTRSVDKSEKLSELLKVAEIPHEVLNAKNHALEADIVKRAGQLGKVTVATNMAGRGTDIKPEPAVIQAGGLHVIGTERHEARCESTGNLPDAPAVREMSAVVSSTYRSRTNCWKGLARTEPLRSPSAVVPESQEIGKATCPCFARRRKTHGAKTPPAAHRPHDVAQAARRDSEGTRGRFAR